MKSRKLLTRSLIGAALLLPTAGMAAEGISYSWLEADYIVQDIDRYEEGGILDNFLDDFDDGDGWGAAGSFAFTDHFFAFGSYSTTEADYTFIDDTGLLIPRNEDVKTLKAGLGFNTPLSSKVDLVARAAYVDVDYGSFNFGASDDNFNNTGDFKDAIRDLNNDSSDGWLADVGVRAQVVNWLELGGGVRYTDLDQGDDFSVFGNALFEITENIGINISGDFGGEISTYMAGVRYSF